MRHMAYDKQRRRSQDLKQTAVYAALAKQWNALNDAEKEFYKQRALETRAERDQYLQEMMPDEREAFLQSKEEKKKARRERIIKQRRKQTGMPPLNTTQAFSIFLSEIESGDTSFESLARAMKTRHEEFKNLSEEQSKIYYDRAKAKEQQRLHNIQEWTAKMVKDGQLDIIPGKWLKRYKKMNKAEK